MTFSLRTFIKMHETEQKVSSIDKGDLLSHFYADLRKMEPTWKVWRLTSAYGFNIQRETGELIRLFRMLDERFWNVYVFADVANVKYRIGAHNKLTLNEAVMLVQRYVREINEKNLAIKGAVIRRV